MNTAEVKNIMAETQAGRLTFPQTVERLLQIEVESYMVDFSARAETVYWSTGETIRENLSIPVAPVAPEFSPECILGAIRSAQADAIRYPEFVRQATAAGVIGYWAYLAGRRVIYFGRKGEIHIEEFPPAQS